MQSWRQFLAKLETDGVTLGQCEEEAIDPDGNRIISHFLLRHVEGKTLWMVIPYDVDSKDDPVPWYVVRQVTNTLRLDPQKYIF